MLLSYLRISNPPGEKKRWDVKKNPKHALLEELFLNMFSFKIIILIYILSNKKEVLGKIKNVFI